MSTATGLKHLFMLLRLSGEPECTLCGYPHSLHVCRNVLAKVPKHAQAEVKGDYWAIFDHIEGEGPKALAEGRR